MRPASAPRGLLEPDRHYQGANHGAKVIPAPADNDRGEQG